MEIIAKILVTAIQYYSWALIGYILMSWFPNARETAIGKFLATICEPYLQPFRKIIPPLGMIDISPIVAIFVLQFAEVGAYQLFRLF